MNEKDTEYLYITSIISGKKCVLEKLPALSFGLYYTNVIMFETYAIVNQSHPRSTMIRKIIENSSGHPLKNQKIFNLMNSHVLLAFKAN